MHDDQSSRGSLPFARHQREMAGQDWALRHAAAYRGKLLHSPVATGHVKLGLDKCQQGNRALLIS